MNQRVMIGVKPVSACEPEYSRGIASTYLAKFFYFIPVRPNSKVASRGYTRGPKSLVAPEGNYGMVPRDPEVFCLDIDYPDSVTTDAQRAAYVSHVCSVLHIDLSAHFHVTTPGKGVHIIMLTPEGKSMTAKKRRGDDVIPKVSLRGHLTSFNEYAQKRGLAYVDDLTVDVRDARCSTYLMGPGSSLLDDNGVEHFYTVTGAVTKPQRMDANTYVALLNCSVSDALLESRKNYAERVRSASADRGSSTAHSTVAQKAAVSRSAGLESTVGASDTTVGEKSPENGVQGVFEPSVSNCSTDNAHTAEDTPVRVLPACDTPPPVNITAHMKRLVSTAVSFHSRRARLYHGLSCCYSVDDIVNIGATMGINRDTASDSELPFHLVKRDMERLEEKTHQEMIDRHREGLPSRVLVSEDNGVTTLKPQHKRFCPHYVKPYAPRRESTPREYTSAFIRYRSPVASWVVDMGMVREKISRITPLNTVQATHAVMIADMFLQPACNAGLSTVLLARHEVARQCNITVSQVGNAVKILRRAGVISIHRRQSSAGKTTAYTVSPEVREDNATTLLRAYKMTTVLKNSGRAVFAEMLFDRTTGDIIRLYDNARVNITAGESTFATDASLSLSVMRRLTTTEKTVVSQGATLVVSRRFRVNNVTIGTTEHSVVTVSGEDFTVPVTTTETTTHHTPYSPRVVDGGETSVDNSHTMRAPPDP